MDCQADGQAGLDEPLPDDVEAFPSELLVLEPPDDFSEDFEEDDSDEDDVDDDPEDSVEPPEDESLLPELRDELVLVAEFLARLSVA